MGWIRWRWLRRRYGRNHALLAAQAEAQWRAGVESAADRFRQQINDLDLKDWQRAGLHERRWR